MKAPFPSVTAVGLEVLLFRRRIGIALKGWTREPATTAKMCSMLFEDSHLALQWATEEATAWFYD